MHRLPRSELHLADPLRPECGGLLSDAAPEEHGPEATLNMWKCCGHGFLSYFPLVLRHQLLDEADEEDQR